MQKNAQEVIAYFTGWPLQRGSTEARAEAASIPWDCVTYVNHAFWYTVPTDGTADSSFQRRASGLGARTQFGIRSLQPEADCGDCGTSALIPELPRNHFAQYAYFAKKYPHVNILISIGGWTRSGFFSEMAYTPEGRASFIASCLELMAHYPWIGGLDIDWEYPAGSTFGERAPDPGDPDDEGCCIFGTAEEDRRNFALLLAELRAELNRVYGPGVKKLTACASGAVEGTLSCQDWAAAAPSLDRINIMSYDLAGIWAGVTGHAGSAGQALACVEYFAALGIPAEKLCIGSPLYGTLFRTKTCTAEPFGAPVEPVRPLPPNVIIDQEQLLQWEQTSVQPGIPGWHAVYDPENGGAYLYNDDPASDFCRFFLSYENSRSLQQKLDNIQIKNIGGIIVWACGFDTPDSRMLRRMHDALQKRR